MRRLSPGATRTPIPGTPREDLTDVFGTAAVLLMFRMPWGLFLALLVAEFIFHYHLDWAKEQVVKRVIRSRDTEKDTEDVPDDEMLYVFTVEGK